MRSLYASTSFWESFVRRSWHWDRAPCRHRSGPGRWQTCSAGCMPRRRTSRHRGGLAVRLKHLVQDRRVAVRARLGEHLHLRDELDDLDVVVRPHPVERLEPFARRNIRGRSALPHLLERFLHREVGASRAQLVEREIAVARRLGHGAEVHLRVLAVEVDVLAVGLFEREDRVELGLQFLLGHARGHEVEQRHRRGVLDGGLHGLLDLRVVGVLIVRAAHRYRIDEREVRAHVHDVHIARVNQGDVGQHERAEREVVGFEQRVHILDRGDRIDAVEERLHVCEPRLLQRLGVGCLVEEDAQLVEVVARLRGVLDYGKVRRLQLGGMIFHRRGGLSLMCCKVIVVVVRVQVVLGRRRCFRQVALYDGRDPRLARKLARRRRRCACLRALLSDTASLALALALLSDALALEPFPDELAELPVFPPQETSAKAITKANISAVIFL